MREKTIRDAANGELAITPSTVPYIAADDGMDGDLAREEEDAALWRRHYGST